MNPADIQQVGPYPVRRFVAEGGMAWVFEVTDPRFDARRALKMLKPAAAEGDEFQRFADEARMLARLDHPNLITIYDFGKDEPSGCYYYTMTFVDGPPLSQVGLMPPDKAIEIFSQVLSGLAKLHDAGIVHRDIKPANIIVTDDGRPLLGDLGIARSADTGRGLTRTGTAIGTSLYMSPEQARGKPVGPASDIFSLGMSIYEVMTGSTVYDKVDGIDTTSGQEVLLYLGSLIHSGEELKVPFPKTIPKGLREVISKALRFDPSQRYQNAGEMRAALEGALSGARGRSAAPSKGAPVMALAGAGALALVAVVGIFVWQQFGGGTLSMTSESDPKEAIAAITAIEQQATSLLATVSALEKAPPSDIISSAEHEIEVANTFLQRGISSFETQKMAEATTSADLARDGYERACATLADGFLKAEANTKAQAIVKRAEGLREIRAESMSPGEWAELEGTLTRMAAAPKSDAECDKAENYLARIGVADEASLLTLAVEQNLMTEWPRLARNARKGAEEAEASARANESSAPEYSSALSEGRLALRKGDTAVADQDFLAAQDAFRAAEASFQSATAIAPAAAARSELRRLQADSGVAGGAVVQRVVEEADALYAAGNWSEATDQYAHASSLFGKLLADAEASRSALGAASQAEQERERAVAAGAARAASAELARGDEIREAATLALEEGWYEDAQRQYGEASGAYSKALATANAAVAEAKQARGDAIASGKGLPDAQRCNSLGSVASDRCKAALGMLQAGDKALAAQDPAAAHARFLEAGDAYAKAVEAQRVHLANQPRPPVIDRRAPSGDRITANKNQRVALSVGASDPNGDELRYAWTIAGKPVGSNKPSLEFEPTGTTRVDLSVSDGKGGETRASWQVVVANRRPNLTLTPRDGTLSAKVGDRLSFNASASDPDGDPVEIAYLVNGRQVGSGQGFALNANKAGRFKVAAVATDASGAKTQVERTVIVTENVIAAIPPTPPPTAIPRPGPPTAASVDPSQTAQATLAEYEAAYEALDIDRLSSVWLMSGQQKNATAAFFKATKSIEMEVATGQASMQGEEISVDFVQRVKAPGTPQAMSKLRAKLVKRGDRWHISSIGPR